MTILARLKGYAAKMGPQGLSTNQQHLRCWQWDHPRDPKSKLYPFHTLKKDFHRDWLSLQKHVDRVMTDVKRERLFWREPESWRFLLDEQCRITLCDWCSDSCEKVREILRNLTRDLRVWRVQTSKLKCSISLYWTQPAETQKPEHRRLLLPIDLLIFTMNGSEIKLVPVEWISWPLVPGLLN